MLEQRQVTIQNRCERMLWIRQKTLHRFNTWYYYIVKPAYKVFITIWVDVYLLHMCQASFLWTASLSFKFESWITVLVKSHWTILYLKHILCTVEPRYNAVVGVHDCGPCCTRGALGVLISATRELLNNSDRRPLHQVHERCRSPACLQHCLIRQCAVYGTY